EARGMPGPLFVKPAEEKCFPARVYAAGHELPGDDVLPGSTPVLVSEPVDWELDVRTFALDGQVLTLSPYWREGRLAQAEDGSWPATEHEALPRRSSVTRERPCLRPLSSTWALFAARAGPWSRRMQRWALGSMVARQTPSCGW